MENREAWACDDWQIAAYRLARLLATERDLRDLNLNNLSGDSIVELRDRRNDVAKHEAARLALKDALIEKAHQNVERSIGPCRE